MQAVILTAELCTRLRSLTNIIPECITSVNSIPINDYVEEHAKGSNISLIKSGFEVIVPSRTSNKMILQVSYLYLFLVLQYGLLGKMCYIY